jgi:hypothetical protein
MNPADTIREATNLIRDAVGFALAEKNIPRAPTWTELVPAHLDAIAAALTELEADRDRAVKEASKTNNHIAAEIQHRKLVEADRDRLADTLRTIADAGAHFSEFARAALDRHTKEQT